MYLNCCGIEQTILDYMSQHFKTADLSIYYFLEKFEPVVFKLTNNDILYFTVLFCFYEHTSIFFVGLNLIDTDLNRMQRALEFKL